MGQVGQVVQFCKEFYSLFPLSLAISLRFTLTISLDLIAILFSRIETGALSYPTSRRMYSR